MSIFDKQRITVVSTLEALGYRFAPNEWKAPTGVVSMVREADQMHALLVRRADQLDGCTENSPEQEELEAIADALGAYERKRWPDGKVPGGKG